MSADFQYATAGLREEHLPCLRCEISIRSGDRLVVCNHCGGLHHESCWDHKPECAGYDCAPDRRRSDELGTPSIRITSSEIESAQAPVAQPRALANWSPIAQSHTRQPRTNRMAIAALIVALLGIPLFGLLTGMVAVVLGCLALGTIRASRQRGTGLAITGVLLGVADVVGWIFVLAIMFSRGGVPPDFVELDADIASIDNLPAPLNRAMCANVLIESSMGPLGAASIGAGVILHIQEPEKRAWIVTNRHVVDARFDEEAESNEIDGDGHLNVHLLGQAETEGTLVWVAPDGIDLALVSVPLVSDVVRSAKWGKSAQATVGDDVFAVGNPQGLGWTHTEGTISQFRTQSVGSRRIRVIQTNTAINPGNSGGGLYDRLGRLIGINTWTNDKRFSEGLSFAISFEEFENLNPPLPESATGDDAQDDREQP